MSIGTNRFEILRRLAVAGSKGEDLTQVSKVALAEAAELVGLTAAALYLWDDKQKATVSVSHAVSDTARKQLQFQEDELFGRLRREKELVSAYMSFGGDTPHHSFTLPLRHGSRIFGAVIGLQEGPQTIVAEDVFLEALSAMLSLSYIADGVSKTAVSNGDDLEKAKLSGIVETAVTVNHEINSPLTAILGNIQLLMRNRDEMDDDLKAKLDTIEKSAERIQSVTHRLMRVTAPRSKEYSEGIQMLDISEDEDED